MELAKDKNARKLFTKNHLQPVKLETVYVGKKM